MVCSKSAKRVCPVEKNSSISSILFFSEQFTPDGQKVFRLL